MGCAWDGSGCRPSACRERVGGDRGCSRGGADPRLRAVSPSGLVGGEERGGEGAGSPHYNRRGEARLRGDVMHGGRSG